MTAEQTDARRTNPTKTKTRHVTPTLPHTTSLHTTPSHTKPLQMQPHTSSVAENNPTVTHTVNPPEREGSNGETYQINPTRNTNGEGQARQRKHTKQRETSKHTPMKGLRKRANIKIASLNMNGLHTTRDGRFSFEKWSEINATVKRDKIAILAVQETHLDEDTTRSITELFGKRLTIINSQLERNPRVSAGVAFVINKDLIEAKETKIQELIKGRAAALTVKWNDQETTMINVYAPNRRQDHKDFWETIENERQRTKTKKPDFVLGDFNVTEEAIDRMPQKMDNFEALAALREFRLKLEIQDQWRHEYPKGREYTYRTNANEHTIKSRLDRIYIAKDKTKFTFDWSMTPSTVKTDHWIVATKYAPKNAPYIGTGRWTMPVKATKNIKITEELIKHGMTLQEEMDEIKNNLATRSTERNHQTLWKNFKLTATKWTKDTMKNTHYRRATKLKNLQKDRKKLLADPNFETNQNLQWSEALLAKEIEYLERKTSKENCEITKAKMILHGEKLGGMWTAMSKSKKPRDHLQRLKIPRTIPQKYESRSKGMARLAKQYHEELQEKDLDPTENERREQAMTNALDTIPNNQKFPHPQNSILNRSVTEDFVSLALLKAKNGSATGMDGCPYELWKELNKEFLEAKKLGRPGFNIIRTLTMVFQDIQEHGVEPGTGFTEGWMCPLYKKKDKTEIENYRPITLLNTDYKLLTKTLSLQLVESINPMIHKDQASFIPGRSIFNHIRLTKIMIQYAEAMEQNGAILALDQEKAYDRLTHNYLWKTLETFELPAHFIKTVKALYETAETKVIINGIISEPYTVKRGVRQGDPISCFLFNLGIEPLACMIRTDKNISGYNIPGTNEQLIINLFANDTVLYLNEHDTLQTTTQILDKWCEASGAKFNKEKTEIIPIGTKTHRDKVIQTRKINQEDQPIGADVHIAKDGEAIRSLGAWVGNVAEDKTPWETIMDKINKSLRMWSNTGPSIFRKKLIAQAVVGGRTQFITKAQGMPENIVETLTNAIKNFIWDDAPNPRLALTMLQDRKDKGGIELLNLKHRNDAIELVWLREYLSKKTVRPTWAYMTDILLNETAPNNLPERARENSFLQKWSAPTKGKRAERIGTDTTRMLKAAKTYNVTFAPIRVAKNLKLAMPAWLQIGHEKTIPQNAQAKCLINAHNAMTVKDLCKITERLKRTYRGGVHTPVFSCHCEDCTDDRTNGCINPQRCAIDAQRRLEKLVPKLNPLGPTHNNNLSLTTQRKAANVVARRENTGIIFDPSVTEKSNLADCFRVFTDPERISNAPAERQRQTRGINLPEENITVYTDGSCMNNGKENARAGAGIWISEENPQNRAIRIPGPNQSNQVGEIAAVIAALESTPTFAPLTIVSDSMYVINGLTEHLEDWENKGWIEVCNRDWFKRAAYLLRKRSATTTFQWVKGHNGNKGNEECDKLAKEGAEKERSDHIDLTIPDHFDVQGAKLATLTQAIAYRGIRERAKKLERKTTQLNLEKIKGDLKDITGEEETNAAIWHNVRMNPIRLRIQQFFFKTIHGTHKIGRYWLNIEGYSQRATCRNCEDDESMNHILTECTHPTTQRIWALAKETWPHGEETWPEITLGTILGCATLQIRTHTVEENRHNRPNVAEPRPNAGATRLIKILISEAAYLIWIMRCERAIRGNEHTERETRAAWRKTLNRRLSEDTTTASRVRRRPDYIKLVKNTWEQSLQKLHGSIPENWIH